MITGILMIVKNQNFLIFCGCLVFFGSLNIIAQVIILIIHAAIYSDNLPYDQIIEIEKNEDTTHEENDMVDVTNRYIAIAVGLVMILQGGLLILLCHLK